MIFVDSPKKNVSLVIIFVGREKHPRKLHFSVVPKKNASLLMIFVGRE